MATDDKVSVILTSTDANGTAKQKSFTYISPNATNGQLKAFAQAANALTENTYNGSKKVTQVDLDNAASDKQTATITLTTASVSLADYKTALQSQDVYEIPFTYDGDATPYAFTSGDARISCSVFNNSGNSTVHVTTPAQWINLIDQNTTITIRADETNTYKAAEATFTITV